MEIVESIDAVRRLAAAARAAGKVVGFVPTMGNLHAGHASLIDAARRKAGFVVVSIFVNPMQFGPREDLAAYPRTPREDHELCRAHRADCIFCPSVQAMYPGASESAGSGCLTEISVPELSNVLCGANRPGHFTGVCTVVAKLFNIVAPDVAFFGAKDFQQTVVVRQMVRDLDFPIRIEVCPTVREADGLAMSSRNGYLTPQERAQAPALYEALQWARQMVLTASQPPQAAWLQQQLRDRIVRSTSLGQVDYITIVDRQTLTSVEQARPPVLIALAVRFGRARLIDNIVIDAGGQAL